MFQARIRIEAGSAEAARPSSDEVAESESWRIASRRPSAVARPQNQYKNVPERIRSRRRAIPLLLREGPSLARSSIAGIYATRLLKNP
jgi:hypothetical protein